MEGQRAGNRRRLRIGLRGMVALLLGIAVALAVLRPIIREPLRQFERYARVKLNERDLYRHAYESPGVAKKFAVAMHSGHFDVAWEMMTADFRRRTGPVEFASFAAASPLSRSPSEPIEGIVKPFDPRGLFVSEVVFRCGEEGDRVLVVLVTEAGRLKVEHLETIGQ